MENKCGMKGLNNYSIRMLLAVLCGILISAAAVDVSARDTTPFSDNLLVIKIGSRYYRSLQEAYNAAGEGDIIQCRSVLLNDALNANRAVEVKISGGYGVYWLAGEDKTVISGKIESGPGTVTLENIVLGNPNGDKAYLKYKPENKYILKGYGKEYAINIRRIEDYCYLQNIFKIEYTRDFKETEQAEEKVFSYIFDYARDNRFVIAC